MTESRRCLARVTLQSLQVMPVQDLVRGREAALQLPQGIEIRAFRDDQYDPFLRGTFTLPTRAGAVVPEADRCTGS